MQHFDRLPAFPLVVNDPYFSIWLPYDLPTDGKTTHWCGNKKPLSLYGKVDGIRYHFLSKENSIPAETTGIRVTPTQTSFTQQAGGVELCYTFMTPDLPDDLDQVSVPATYLTLSVRSLDGKPHQVELGFSASGSLCKENDGPAPMDFFSFDVKGYHFGRLGQAIQRMLSTCGDNVCIDWGYLYMAGNVPVEARSGGIHARWTLEATAESQQAVLVLGYDDVASINYFGRICQAWYARNGKSLLQAMTDMLEGYDGIKARCEALDAQLLQEADRIGGEDYQLIVSAAWRQAFGAHKLIATPEGEMAFLSKENDSNGCIGTVDVSYPSIPLFLKYCPELVNALSRPILQFANMPVWEADYAPHDVGRYPYATGQRYGMHEETPGGYAIPPLYSMPAGQNLYKFANQMPVEESGNMLVMIDTAIRFGADDKLAKENMPTLGKWARYLEEFGEDPAEQLCTDDFAGHLAHNVNLSAKAIVGLCCYAHLLEHFGQKEEAAQWQQKAKGMAQSMVDRIGAEGDTPLTYDGKGWSQKYNLAWDRILGLNLLPEDFYRKETNSYLKRINRYGLPLDSRAAYTKADWILWCAAMAPDEETRRKLIAPVATCLRESQSRVAFSDWYYTDSGRYVSFIARSVVGGVFMPMLMK